MTPRLLQNANIIPGSYQIFPPNYPQLSFPELKDLILLLRCPAAFVTEIPGSIFVNPVLNSAYPINKQAITSRMPRRPPKRKRGQLLTTDQEAEVVIDATRYLRCGQRISNYQFIPHLANARFHGVSPSERILRRPLSLQWWIGFLRRHPYLKEKTDEIRSLTKRDARGNCISQFQSLLDELQISAENTYAMIPDHGFKLNRYRKNERMTLCQPFHPEGMVESDMASAIFCVSRTGQFIKPGVIFKDKENLATGFKYEWEVYHKTNRSGWADGDATYDWLEKVFEPETRPHVSDNEEVPWRMLIVSDPSSRLDGSFFMSCIKKRILCFRLPSERVAGDKLDPFSCGISGFINVRFSEKVEDQWGESTSHIQIGRMNFCHTMFRIAQGPGPRPILRTKKVERAWAHCALISNLVTTPDNPRTASPPQDDAPQQGEDTGDPDIEDIEPMEAHDNELNRFGSILANDLESSTCSPVVTPSRTGRARKRRRGSSRPGNEEREQSGMHDAFILS